MDDGNADGEMASADFVIDQVQTFLATGGREHSHYE